MSTNHLTPEQQERLRALYRKCDLGLVLLPPEALADEFPDLVKGLPRRQPPGATGLDQPLARPDSSPATPGGAA